MFYLLSESPVHLSPNIHRRVLFDKIHIPPFKRNFKLTCFDDISVCCCCPCGACPHSCCHHYQVRRGYVRGNHISNSGRGWGSHCQSLVTCSTFSRMGFMPWRANANFVMFCYKGVKVDGTPTDCIASALLENEY